MTLATNFTVIWSEEENVYIYICMYVSSKFIINLAKQPEHFWRSIKPLTLCSLLLVDSELSSMQEESVMVVEIQESREKSVETSFWPFIIL